MSTLAGRTLLPSAWASFRIVGPRTSKETSHEASAHARCACHALLHRASGTGPASAAAGGRSRVGQGASEDGCRDADGADSGVSDSDRTRQAPDLQVQVAA